MFFQGELAGFNFGEIQNVTNQGQEVFTGIADTRQILMLLAIFFVISSAVS